MPNIVGTSNVPWVVRGRGSIRRADSSASVLFNLSRDKYSHSRAWRVEATCTSQPRDLHGVFSAGQLNDPISLVGLTDIGHRHIAIQSIPLPKVTNGTLTADVWQFDLYQPQLDFAPKAWSVTIYLTDNPLALSQAERVRDPRGFHEEWGDRTAPATWCTPLGQAEFTRLISFETVEAGDLTGDLEVSTPAVQITISGDQFTTFPDLANAVEEWLADTLRVIGFLARRRTMWTHIRAVARGTEAGSWYEGERFQIAANTSTRSLVEHALVLPQKIAEIASGGFLERLRDHPARDKLTTAIDLLAVSREESVSFGSHRFISAFTAFEAAVTAYAAFRKFGSALSDRQRKWFIAAVRKAISVFGQSEMLSEEFLAASAKKVPDLLRPGFVGLAEQVLAELSVDVADILPAGVSLSKELRAIGKRRGALVHAGDESPIGQAFADEARLNYMTERLIYSWLGGKTEWHHPVFRRDLEWLTRSSAEDV